MVNLHCALGGGQLIGLSFVFDTRGLLTGGVRGNILIFSNGSWVSTCDRNGLQILCCRDLSSEYIHF
jgi:hypothetical protein